MYDCLKIQVSASEPFTDYSRWRLLVSDVGRHTWHYLKSDEECEKWPQNTCDKFWLGLPVVRSSSQVIDVIPKSGYRICPSYRDLKRPGMLPGTDTLSTRIFRRMTAIGQENTVALYF